ncbi:endonuclease domain-containing protein [Microbacterium phyllosphaerae]|uniref:endonuclease domain-containing protein n=1 Tax=Microbacterium phyllosphaerae TaxID=124798 RepID=UPI003D657935
MTPRDDLPDEFIGTGFSVHIARLHGVSRSRLRGVDLEAPFFGVRAPARSVPTFDDVEDPYERQRRARVHRAHAYAPRLHTGHFFSHHTAASVWGAPLPLEFAEDDTITGYSDLHLHVSAAGHTPFPRAAGTVGHRTLASMTEVTVHDGLRVTSPAATWASLGGLPLFDIVAIGDHMCRVWRDGRGRPTPGRTPLSTREGLRTMLDAGRRRGAARLRDALELVREDSWSPRETRVRCILVAGGLPEPELNVDLYDEAGRFLACVDMAYREARVIIEYLGMLHGERWAADVERLARLRAAGWVVIEVTSPLLRRRTELVRRVSEALGI